MSSLLFDFLHR